MVFEAGAWTKTTGATGAREERAPLVLKKVPWTDFPSQPRAGARAPLVWWKTDLAEEEAKQAKRT